jgi:hypothetical protein
MAVEKQNKEGKKIWVLAILVNQPVLKYFNFNIKTKLIKGLVEYLYSFSTCKPQYHTKSIQLGDKN